MTLTLFAGPLQAVSNPQAAVAEDKAEVLEEKVVNDAPPPKRSEILTPGEVRAVDPAGQSPMDDSITCLARTLYWEAKGTDAEDMQAVANVVINRLGHDGFPDTVCAVVKQGVETKSCQFSWWCDGRPDQVEEAQRYGVAKEIARKALNQQLPDRTRGALYFHDRSVRPAWAKAFRRTLQTHHFIFYKPNPSVAR